MRLVLDPARQQGTIGDAASLGRVSAGRLVSIRFLIGRHERQIPSKTGGEALAIGFRRGGPHSHLRVMPYYRPSSYRHPLATIRPRQDLAKPKIQAHPSQCHIPSSRHRMYKPRTPESRHLGDSSHSPGPSSTTRLPLIHTYFPSHQHHRQASTPAPTPVPATCSHATFRAIREARAPAESAEEDYQHH